MTRVEYIRQLEFSLNGKLPKREISEILRDYSEYFEEGKSAGKSEEEIAVSLGIPSLVAEQILSELEQEGEEPAKKGPRYFWQRARDKWGALLRSGHVAGYGEAPGGTAAPPPQQPPQPAPPPLQPVRRRGFARRLLAVLLCLVLVPLALLIAIPVAAALVMLVVALIVLLLAVLLAFAAGAAASAILVTIIGPSVGFALSAVAVAGIVFCLAGCVLSLCGVAYLIRGVGRLVRACFGGGKRTNTARNPAYQAQSVAAGTPPQAAASPAPGQGQPQADSWQPPAPPTLELPVEEEAAEPVFPGEPPQYPLWQNTEGQAEDAGASEGEKEQKEGRADA